MSMIQIDSTAQFDQLLIDNKNDLCIACFTTSWSDCHSEYLEALQDLLEANDRDAWKATKWMIVDGQKCPELFARYGIQEVPTQLFLQSLQLILLQIHKSLGQ